MLKKIAYLLASAASYIVVAGTIIVIMVSVAEGQGAERVGKIGDVTLHFNYCTTDESAKILGEAIKVGGDESYVEVMNEPTIMCYDSRMHGSRFGPIKVILADYMYSVLHTDGTIYEFWHAADSIGTKGVIWLSEDNHTPIGRKGQDV